MTPSQPHYGARVSSSWDDLAAAALARQFPADPTAATSPPRLHAIGRCRRRPRARAFLGLAARFPGTTHDEITAAYAGRRDRARQHDPRHGPHGDAPSSTPCSAEATRRRAAPPLGADARHRARRRVADLWAAIEDYAREWRTPEELRHHLRRLAGRARGPRPATRPSTAGRYLAFGHGGLVRRPGQRATVGGPGQAGLRAPSTARGRRRSADVVALHLAATARRRARTSPGGPGPARVVEEGLAGLDARSRRDGPDGRGYLDLPDAPAPRDLPGVRLLPEFDALLCGYDSEGPRPLRDARAPSAGCGTTPTGCCSRRCSSTAGSPATGGPPARRGATARGHLVRPHPPAPQGRARRAGRGARGGPRHHRHRR